MTKPTKEEWEKEFDRLFMFLNKRARDPNGTGQIEMWELRKNITPKELKSFIQQAINKEVKEVLERVRIKKRKSISMADPILYNNGKIYDWGYNQAVQKLNQKIKKELEEK